MEPEPEPAADGAPTAASIPTRVVVTLFAGHSLPAEDWDTGKSDPYVEMRVLSGDARKPVKSEKHTSSIITESLDPQWGGEHGEHFQVMDSLGATGDSWLRLKVWDHDHVAADDFIGMADVKLMEVQAADGHTLKQEVPLTDRKGRDVNGKAGRAKIELQVQLFYNEDRSTLVREHSVAKHSGLAKWFFKNEGVEAYYTIAEELGSGSFATVKKGIRKSDGAVFAVKFIDKTALKKDDEAMLESECSVLKQMAHPNIVKLFEIYTMPEQLVLVMEFVDGGEMLEKLKVAERYNETDAANTVHKIVDALVYIHSKGIAHRDLKPENLLLTHGDDTVKIVDFGFAKMMNDDTMLQTACGTPEYVAPEVLQQKGYDVECDIWSLGVVIYVMCDKTQRAAHAVREACVDWLCGRPPFWSRNQRKLFEQIQREEVTFRADYGWGSVSKEAQELIKKMLAKDPAQRITAAEILEDPWLVDKASFNLNDLKTASCQLGDYLAGSLKEHD